MTIMLVVVMITVVMRRWLIIMMVITRTMVTMLIMVIVTRQWLRWRWLGKWWRWQWFWWGQRGDDNGDVDHFSGDASVATAAASQICRSTYWRYRWLFPSADDVSWLPSKVPAEHRGALFAPHLHHLFLLVLSFTHNMPREALLVPPPPALQMVFLDLDVWPSGSLLLP